MYIDKLCQQQERKYRNKKVEYNGMLFDSKKELKRYQELLILLRAGEIDNLQRQITYELLPAFTKHKKKYRNICYVADFQYTDKAGNVIVEDVKGMRTDVYLMKKKMFEYMYKNLIIKEL